MYQVILGWLRALAPYAAKAAAAAGFAMLIKDMIQAMIQSAGAAVVESVSSSPFVIIAVTCVVFIYAASFLGKKKLLDRRISFAILALFCLTLASSKTVMKEVKQAIHTPQFMTAKAYVSGDRSLKQVYRDNDVYNSDQKHKFAMSLLRANTAEERELFKAVINDGIGWFSCSFNKKELTHNCICYSDIDMFNFLKDKGLLELEESIKYNKKGITTSLSNKQYYCAYDLAVNESNKPIVRRIRELNNMDKHSFYNRSKDTVLGYFYSNPQVNK